LIQYLANKEIANCLARKMTPGLPPVLLAPKIDIGNDVFNLTPHIRHCPTTTSSTSINKELEQNTWYLIQF
jgi:hypothetical protein